MKIDVQDAMDTSAVHMHAPRPTHLYLFLLKNLQDSGRDLLLAHRHLEDLKFFVA